jgi:transcriptional regulator with XRE-family HTH domain
MDLPSAIRRRLKELGIEQKDLAAAADVTESYISQLLSMKKAPPAPNRTDIYSKMENLLRVPDGTLSKLADLHRQADLKQKVESPPRPLYKECRELILRKCKPAKQDRMRKAFEREPFGELERLVTQKLLDVTQGVAKQELENEDWLRRVARLTDRSYGQMRVMVLEFLETDVLSVSAGNCLSFLDPLIESWGMDFETFGVEVLLNRELVLEPSRKFEFVESKPEPSCGAQPGLEEFLEDTTLSGGATEEEIEFLKRLPFGTRQPTPLYYYRELQSLRDPLHFGAARAKTPTGTSRMRSRVR